MATEVLYPVLAAVLSYFIGAIPFGWIAGRLVKGIDIRHYGSGRVGATNTLRTLGWRVSALVFAADLLKGLGPVLAVHSLLNNPLAESMTALAAMLGHCWSPYIGFYGGRGVTTSLGSLFVINPLIAIAGLAVTLVTVAVTRLVSLGSLLGSTAALALMVALVYFGRLSETYLIFIVGAFSVILFQHRDNVDRLLKGSERRLGERSAKINDSNS